jgi:hypothetical protein
MKITSISYKKIFPIAQFVNETIGVEIQVDEGDDTDEAFKIAKETVEQWASVKIEEKSIDYFGETNEDIVVRRINTSESLSELSEWKDDAARNGLMKIYMTKAKKLAGV